MIWTPLCSAITKHVTVFLNPPNRVTLLSTRHRSIDQVYEKFPKNGDIIHAYNHSRNIVPLIQVCVLKPTKNRNDSSSQFKEVRTWTFRYVNMKKKIIYCT